MNTLDVGNPRLLAVHPVLMARDVQRSVGFFVELSFVIAFVDNPDHPKYAALRRDDVEIHIQWNELPGAEHGQDRPVYRFLVRDVDALYREFSARAPSALASARTTPWHAPAHTPWGTREFHIHDPDGNGLQFYQSSPHADANDS
jgi:catechol 2,3-dioxygenase-like lactoylglutathione lyase family enzyme